MFQFRHDDEVLWCVVQWVEVFMVNVTPFKPNPADFWECFCHNDVVESLGVPPKTNHTPTFVDTSLENSIVVPESFLVTDEVAWVSINFSPFFNEFIGFHNTMKTV